MASPFSSLLSNTPSFSSWSSSPSVTITSEEFNAFHKIDRTLFTRLVFDLNRDMIESIQVIGFLFLLEQNHYARNLISSLVSSPDAFIDAVAKQTLVCLSFLFHKDYYAFMFVDPNNNNNDYDQSLIPLIIRITGGRLGLNVINQNRKSLLRGLKSILIDVCDRAFEDLCERAERDKKEKILATGREKVIENLKKVGLGVPQGTSCRSCVQQVRVPTPPPVEEESNKVVEDTAAEEEEEAEIAADDRTVFLTFSKGYPISEEELRVFFTRRFGEVIEEIVMQEVEENEQPLYARMVLKMCYVSKMEQFVRRRSRNKFTVNGKHVWARKYVRKNLTSSASPSSSHI